MNGVNRVGIGTKRLAGVVVVDEAETLGMKEGLALLPFIVGEIYLQWKNGIFKA